jgi:transposase
MALGRRKSGGQEDLFVLATDLPKSVGHVFYQKLNTLLREAGFDAWVEELCKPHYSEGVGRPGVPPGVYFRMLLVGYFEGIQSQRGIAWRCADSLSLRSFLGIALTEQTPDHSSLTKIRERLPQEVHEAMFRWVLKVASDKQLLNGKAVAVDSSTLEANAAMKSIVRRDTGEDWREYVVGIMRREGVIESGAQPTDDEVRAFDKKRKGKSAANDDWVSTTDPDARIAKMKDGTTHLAYKTEHVVDADSNLILAAEIYAGDNADTNTIEDSLQAAQTHLNEAAIDAKITEVVADKGYHSTDLLETLAQRTQFRSYIAEPKSPTGKRNWKGVSKLKRKAVEANRRRLKAAKGKKLQRVRSEKVERTFAHVLETGGARRTWLRGFDKVRKRHSIATAAYNLGVLMRTLFGIGTARGLQAFNEGLEGLLAFIYLAWITTKGLRSQPGEGKCILARSSRFQFA